MEHNNCCKSNLKIYTHHDESLYGISFYECSICGYITNSRTAWLVYNNIKKKHIMNYKGNYELMSKDALLDKKRVFYRKLSYDFTIGMLAQWVYMI